MTNGRLPEILAPAGDRTSFLAALAAGADAVYCGLKKFSARMAAHNFSIEELAGLTQLAHDKGTAVYVAVNNILTPKDLQDAGQLLSDLTRRVNPDAFIFQDISLVHLAKEAGFQGELHLSTLANLSFPAGLGVARNALGADRVVIPRELTIDEIRAMAAACPPGLDLEVFVHGALCYGVSGRCYWSSYMGGKSGLRGRCVQPCRRIYSQDGKKGRFFSCRDLGLDVLVKVIKDIPQIRAWKIEGRKKGPHYVHYVTAAYKMLRDEGHDVNARRSALQLLEMALGRPATHYGFLPQRPYNPIPADGQTGSGYIVGHVKGPVGKGFLSPRIPLLPGDVLRFGYEDQASHGVQKLTRSVPKGGRLQIKTGSRKGPAKGTPVFLVDRREPALERMITSLSAEINESPVPPETAGFALDLPDPAPHSGPSRTMTVIRPRPGRRPSGSTGVWMTAFRLTEQSPDSVGDTAIPTVDPNVWQWLPPVIWPGEKGREEAAWRSAVEMALAKGAFRFVLNAPWQIAFFPDPKSVELWAGPFCNAANPLALAVLKDMGFAGVVISPELGGDDCLTLGRQSSLPWGMVVKGNWPLCVSRTLSEDLKPHRLFSSPRGEDAWVAVYGSDIWIYPNWIIDLSEKRKLLENAGCRLFIHLKEPLPKGAALKDRPGLWNWDLGLA